jgi:exopolysaccharide biosynthesis WecB/TagA/CpsF family protein
MKRRSFAFDYSVTNYDPGSEVLLRKGITNERFETSTTKRQLFTVNYSITDYDQASDIIVEKGIAHESFGVSALAVHGLMESVIDSSFCNDLNEIDLIVPDGQPIRWALNSFYGVGLKDRVAGPILTKHVLAKANERCFRIYLYGSTQETLQKIEEFISTHYPNVTICGTHADRFREATLEEDEADIAKVNAAKPNVVFVGRGCPRQEKWVANHLGKINAPMMAVGAAFDFMASNIKHAPKWMQNLGLEWLYRLIQDPNKLWKRYLKTNTYFIYLIILCKLGIRKIHY